MRLDGDWRLLFFPEAGLPVKHPDDLAAHADQVIPARVPGNAELDLQAAGILPEPFYAGNIRRLREYEFYCQRPAALPDRVGGRRPEVRQPLSGGDAAVRPGTIS